MAILKILKKNGEEMKIPVKESVDQIDNLCMIREAGRHTKVKLTEPDGKPRLIQMGYIYDIIEDGSINEALQDG